MGSGGMTFLSISGLLQQIPGQIPLIPGVLSLEKSNLAKGHVFCQNFVFDFFSFFLFFFFWGGEIPVLKITKY